MLEDYNAMSKKPMELVIFPFAVEHVCRVLRIVKQPLGNALLAGVGGSGRQSLTALATHMADFTMFQIELSKNYDNAAWKDDLKRLLRLAGEKGDPNSYKVRRAKVGGYKDFFSDEETARIVAFVEKTLSSAFGYERSPSPEGAASA